MPQPAQVDDPPNAGLEGRPGEAGGRESVLPGRIPRGAHRVNQVVGRLDVPDGTREGGGIEHVALDDLRGFRKMARERLASPDQTAHPTAGLHEPFAQAASHVAAGAREENQTAAAPASSAVVHRPNHPRASFLLGEIPAWREASARRCDTDSTRLATSVCRAPECP